VSDFYLGGLEMAEKREKPEAISTTVPDKHHIIEANKIELPLYTKEELYNLIASAGIPLKIGYQDDSSEFNLDTVVSPKLASEP
jgi:hypothetical protein